jgi:hypothetical protein
MLKATPSGGASKIFLGGHALSLLEFCFIFLMLFSDLSYSTIGLDSHETIQNTLWLRGGVGMVHRSPSEGAYVARPGRLRERHLRGGKGGGIGK